MKNTLYFVLILSLLFASCASSTLIETKPEAADVYINNEYAGKSPVVMKDYKFATSTTYIKLEKEGYETLQTSICRDEKIDIGAAIAGAFFYYPWLWVFEYKPLHSYILNPLSADNDLDDDYYFEDDNFDIEIDDNNNVLDIETQQTSNPKADKLRELKGLFDDGILTEEEYEIEKTKILANDNW